MHFPSSIAGSLGNELTLPSLATAEVGVPSDPRVVKSFTISAPSSKALTNDPSEANDSITIWIGLEEALASFRKISLRRRGVCMTVPPFGRDERGVAGIGSTAGVGVGIGGRAGAPRRKRT